MSGESNEQLTDGLRAFYRGRYDDAARLLLPCAEAGELDAILVMYRLYYAGNGVPRDHKQYLYWLQQAATHGDKSAMAKLKQQSEA